MTDVMNNEGRKSLDDMVNEAVASGYVPPEMVDDEGNPVEPLDTADDPEALVQVEMARAMAQATVGTVLAEETEIEVDGQTIQIEPSTKPRPAPSTPAVNTGLNAPTEGVPRVVALLEAKQAVVVTRNEYLAALADYVTALEAELGIQS